MLWIRRGVLNSGRCFWILLCVLDSRGWILGSVSHSQFSQLAIELHLEQLLRLFRALQTFRVLSISTYAQLKHELIVL